MPYYRSKVGLVQGEILLKRDRVQEAESYIQEGLSLAKDEFYFPMMVRGWMLYAKYLAAADRLSQARTYCLRALQVAKRVERPALHSEIFHTLGKIEASLGNREAAIQRYSQALQILKARLLHISPHYRQGFSKQFILPIEVDRDEILPTESRTVPRFCVQLRHLANLRGETVCEGEMGERTLEIVAEALPSIAANLLLRNTPSEELSLVASIGRCRRTGKELVAQSWKGERLFLSRNASAVDWDERNSLGIPLCDNGHLLGLLYVEDKGQGISEEQLDFLSCVASILELQLIHRFEERDISVDFGDSLRVDEQRVIVGKHAVMQKLFAEIKSAASSNSTVLIAGESGTGKELVAQGIHSLSDRRRERFLPINCSALPPDLIESELFGHSRGSFTGAVEGKLGLFEAASKGTLFLDEIDTMPVGLQSRLLRVLEEKKIRRLGETEQRPIDVRVVAASNQALNGLIRKGEFREDLYHRLNVCQIRVPPLRKRLSDLPFLIRYILAGLNGETGNEKDVSDAALLLLTRYSFPGNVRELENIIESAYHLTVGRSISSEHIAWRLEDYPVPHNKSSHVETIVEVLASGKGDFWGTVRDPFLDRDLSREEVRQIIALGLGVCNGRYRRLIKHFNLPDRDYKRFLSFLSNHNCKVNFRQFRR
ncbi:MAG: sigma 54-interacting transcriptional regulator [Acidobacteriota bacterium]